MSKQGGEKIHKAIRIMEWPRGKAWVVALDVANSRAGYRHRRQRVSYQRREHAWMVTDEVNGRA